MSKRSCQFYPQPRPPVCTYAGRYVNLQRPDGRSSFPVEVDEAGLLCLSEVIERCFGISMDKATKKCWPILKDPALKQQVVKKKVQYCGKIKWMNCVCQEVCREVMLRIYETNLRKNVSPEHEALVAWMEKHLPKVAVTCAQCNEQYIIDLQAINNSKGVNNPSIVHNFNYFLTGGFSLDLAICDKQSKQVLAVVEIRKRSKVTKKKADRLAADDILWCEVTVDSVDVKQPPLKQPIRASQGSMCCKCMTVKKAAQQNAGYFNAESKPASEEEEEEEEEEETDEEDCTTPPGSEEKMANSRNQTPNQ